MSEKTTTYSVDLMTRVEGEGRFVLTMDGDRVVDAQLAIFEAPRFFEAFLPGRHRDEVPDITARICGICPVAYQMSACRAIERAVGVTPGEDIRKLRRLLYCGEWIESHALHVYMLHAPDFLGYDGALEMAADHRARVEQGLRIRRAGNALVELLGGRASHPVSPRIGGFTKAPKPAALAPMRAQLAAALDDALDGTRWAASLTPPVLDCDYVYVALDGGGAYPLEDGDHICVSGRDPVPVDDFLDLVEEIQVPYSNALNARFKDGGGSYLTGPLARLHHHAEALHPTAREVMDEVGLERAVRNPHRSIAVRMVETVHALAEAIDLIDGYARPEPPFVEVPLADAVGSGATEAPRGLLFHRYRQAADGAIVEATIMPPTSQNQARMEDDLAALGPRLAGMDHAEATALCERVIRAYDPCISCATHFLDFRVERS